MAARRAVPDIADSGVTLFPSCGVWLVSGAVNGVGDAFVSDSYWVMLRNDS